MAQIERAPGGGGSASTYCDTGSKKPQRLAPKPFGALLSTRGGFGRRGRPRERWGITAILEVLQRGEGEATRSEISSERTLFLQPME
jgi:hypothetical protein